jgi:hypothetical protein
MVDYEKKFLLRGMVALCNFRENYHFYRDGTFVASENLGRRGGNACIKLGKGEVICGEGVARGRIIQDRQRFAQSELTGAGSVRTTREWISQ